jgi:enediyne biosynthesis protein E3
MKSLRRVFLGISPRETMVVHRGFRCDDSDVRARIEQIGRTFVDGYHAALDDDRPDRLGPPLDAVDLEMRGFAFEGAAMALTLLDALTPWHRTRFRTFVMGPGAAHVYMAHVGAGWAMARLHLRVDNALARLDPLYCWLAMDGYGFHEGYFRAPRAVDLHHVPAGLTGYARRAFDQGLGRSLWFVEGADIPRISATIGGFPEQRRADLWSGIGLACAYAGGADEWQVNALKRAAGIYLPQVGQGAAFAAKARQRAGNPAQHTEVACRTLCHMSAEEALALTDATLERLPEESANPAYEVWRRRIQDALIREEVVA